MSGWQPLERRPAPPRVVLSDHARERAGEMGVAEAEVLECVADPGTDCPSSPAGHYPHARVAQRGRLAVPYSTRPGGLRVAITVLWAHATERSARPSDPGGILYLGSQEEEAECRRDD